MTSKPSHTPIYTREDLAKLVAQHDREHPDHDRDCSCRNGVIAALRTYFAPAVRPVSTVTAYVPPDSQSADGQDDGKERKPWLTRRAGEARAQYDHRISHSCFNCGTFIVDRNALDLHEDECSQQGRRGKTGDE